MKPMHTAMKTRLARAVLRAVIAAAVVLPSPASALQLMSIVGLEVAADEHVESFKIEADFVDVLAVCHVPEEWRIVAGTYVGGACQLEGEAGEGVAGLRQETLGELRRLFLIKDPHPFYPIVPVGEVEVRAYDSGELRKILLQPGNYLFETADRCP